MKKLKKILLFGLILVFALPLLLVNINHKNSASAAESNVKLYATISVSDQVLDSNMLNTTDGATHVITNSATTITFDYLSYNYRVNLSDANNFYAHTITITLEKDESTGQFPASFEINGTVFQHSIITGYVALYKTESQVSPGAIPTLHSNYSDLLSYTETETTRTISLITSYTLEESAPESSISYSVYRYQTEISGKPNVNDDIVVVFERPIVNFNTDDTISFECVGLDVGNTPFIDTKIPREHSYSNVKLSFTNNDYTESNPLYFDINRNGFVYTYKLYSKNVDSKDLLFVEYYDEQRPTNNASLATKFYENGTIKEQVFKYIEDTSDFNEFLIDFNKTGRYEIEVYDSTYALGLKNCNYYSTSFYIKNENAGNTAFENVYVIFQTLEDDGNPIDYVVSESTLNNNVQITIKNLPFYFEKDTIVEDADIVFDFTITTFGGSTNIPVTTSYTKKQLEGMLNDDDDLVITVSEDAFYELTLYQYHIDETTQEKVKGGKVYDKTSGDLIKSYEQNYNFSVVKAPKTSFTKYLVNSEYEVVYDANGNPKTTTKEATIPFKVVRDYANYRNIKSKLTLSFGFADDQERFCLRR